MRLLDGLLGIKRLDVNGTELPARQWWRIIAGATAVDNPSNGSTDITIAGGGIELSDAPPSATGPTSEAGVSPKAMRGDAVIAHGDLAGGSLHAVAVASVAGVGGSAGFASAAMAEAAGEVPQMLLDIAALPGTYAPIVHTHNHNTLSGLTTGDPHTQYVLRTDGSTYGNSNTWAIRNAQARVEARGIYNLSSDPLTPAELLGANHATIQAGTNPSNAAAGVTIVARGGGIKLQVNDATTPATVRTPLEIVREASGVGTADAVVGQCSLSIASASDPGKSMKWLAGGDFSLSTESVNADGRRYFDHGSDGASLSNSSLAIAPKSWSASGSTLTIDCSMSNVHKITVTADTTIALTNTRAGAHYTFDFTGGATGGAITLTPTTSFVRMDATGSPGTLSIGAGGVGGKGFVFGYAVADSGPVYIIHQDAVPTG